MLKYNGSILKVNNGISTLGYEPPKGTVIYSNAAQINASTYIGGAIPWTDYDFMLFKFNCWLTSSSNNGCNGCIASNPPNDSWRVNIKRRDTIFGSNNCFAIEKGAWMANAVIDDSGVAEFSAWGSGVIFYTIPATPSSSSNEFRVIVDRTQNIVYLYLNGVLKLHKTGFSNYITNAYIWAKENCSMNNVYVVGCPYLQTARDWTP